MISITKRSEPKMLQHYRLQDGTVFDGKDFTPVKQAIRDQLVAEQGYLCAYCMSRIEPDESSMKVEHWHSRKKYPKQQLTYANLLGCCYGNKGNKPSHQHCDTRKGDAVLLFNPADSEHPKKLKIHYLSNGKIFSDDKEFNCQLDDVLNLNYSRLKENRAGVWNAVTKALKKYSGTVTGAQVEALLLKWQRKDSDGKLKVYCGVAIYYLNKKLQSCL